MLLATRIDEVTEDRKLTHTGQVQRDSPFWAYLIQKDRHLLELHSRGMSYRQIGEILRMNSGTVSRRIASIQQRLNRPIVRTLELVADKLDPLDLTIARHHFIGGLVVSLIAKCLQLSPGMVRNKLAYLTGLLEEMSRRQNRF